MKKIISLALCAAMLGTALSATQISGDEPRVTLSSVSPLELEDGYIKGLAPNITVNDLLCNFENKKALTVTSAKGEVLSGEDTVGTKTVISSGNDGVTLAVNGDVNCDGRVNAADSVLLLRKLAMWEVEVDPMASDVTGDSKLNTSDAVYILRFIAGWDVVMSKYQKAAVAENEDSTVQLYFDSVMNRVARSNTASSGNYSYTARMAKNEIEDIQLFLTSESDMENMTLSVSPFTNAVGDVLDCTVRYEYYYELEMYNQLVGADYANTTNDYYADPLPLLREPFALSANQSKGFVIQLKSTAHTPAGLYKSTVELKDGEGKAVKTADVFAYVWDFTLDETPATATAFAAGYRMPSDVDYSKLTSDDLSLWYSEYYDYLLDNKISSYYLPYDITDERSDAYMNDPRVTSFATYIHGYGGVYEKSDDQVKRSYEKLRTNPEWLDKAYIYFVDEPWNDEGYNITLERYEHYKNLIPERDFQVMIPFGQNYADKQKKDMFELLSDISDIMVPIAGHFTPYMTKADRTEHPEDWMKGQEREMMSSKVYKQYGQFRPRYEALRERCPDKKMWWYICIGPVMPFANFFQYYQGAWVRTVLWQQYMFDIDGLLYYSTCNWAEVSKRRTSHDGDGLLLYYGELFGQERGPVPSIRFESVRDGIEDFQYLTQLEREMGRERSMEYVNRITTHILKFEEDYHAIESVRREMGYVLEGYTK